MSFYLMLQFLVDCRSYFVGIHDTKFNFFLVMRKNVRAKPQARLSLDSRLICRLYSC